MPVASGGQPGACALLAGQVRGRYGKALQLAGACVLWGPDEPVCWSAVMPSGRYAAGAHPRRRRTGMHWRVARGTPWPAPRSSHRPACRSQPRRSPRGRTHAARALWRTARHHIATTHWHLRAASEHDAANTLTSRWVKGLGLWWGGGAPRGQRRAEATERQRAQRPRLPGRRARRPQRLIRQRVQQRRHALPR
jgi:hypothetical protein